MHFPKRYALESELWKWQFKLDWLILVNTNWVAQTKPLVYSGFPYFVSALNLYRITTKLVVLFEGAYNQFN